MKKIALALTVLITLTSVLFSVGCKESNKANIVYEMTISLNDNQLNGKQKVSFTNFTDNTFNLLKFNLFGNAFRKGAEYNPIAVQYENRAYPNGYSYGEMNITSVKSKNQPLTFSICGQDENVLQVELIEELFPNQTVEVDIEYTLKLANVVARTGINEHTINLGNFYPILCGINENGFYECVYYSNGDPFYSDVSDYYVEVELQSDWIVASGGKLVQERNTNDKIKRCYELKSARSFCMIISKQFQTLTEMVDGVQVNYYYYKDSTPKDSLNYAIESLKLFSEKFGKYPYSTYSVVQTEFLQGGMEYPAIVMISDNLEPKAYGEVIVHETAHQWWQSAVGNNEIEFGFLDEGLAEYSVVLFYENYSKYGMKRESMITSSEQTYKTFCSVSDKLFGKVNTVMLRNLGQFNSEYEYVNMAYVKPCIMYDYLRKSVGDQTFFKGLKKYYSTYYMKNATPYDLVGAFEKVGADSNGFFQSFFDGKVII